MARLSKNAEDYNSKPAANTINAASNESAHNDESISTGSRDQAGKRHSFSRKLAREIQKRKCDDAGHGAHEALVLKYLAHRVRGSKKVIDGKKRFYITIRELHELFPYLGATTIYEIILRLKEFGYVEVGNFNQHKYDKTFWYHVPTAVQNAAEEDVIYFDSQDAITVKVPAAVVLDNFHYWIHEREVRGVAQQVEMSPARLSELLPFSVDTIKRALKKLENKFIKKLSDTQPIYGKYSEYFGADPNNIGANPNSNGANPNRIGANPNDDTSYVTISNPLENSSKEKPAASFFENASNVTKNISYSLSASTDSTAEVGHQEVTTPAPSNIPGFAGNMRGMEIFFHSPASLHEQNRLLALEHKQLPTDVQEKMLNIVSDTAKVFLTHNQQNIIPWNDIDDEDELYQTIRNAFIRFINEHTIIPSQAAPIALMLFSGTLETILGAFLFDRIAAPSSFTHGNSELQRSVYWTHMIVWQVLEQENKRLVEEEFCELKHIHASPDEHKENDAALSPAEKARVFRNALTSRNKVGWIFYEKSYRKDVVKVSATALQLVQKIFEHNPDATAADLLKLMDQCIDAYRNEPAPPKKYHPDINWHVRTAGANLGSFAMYLKVIVRHCESITCPIKTFLGDINEEQEDVALAA